MPAASFASLPVPTRDPGRIARDHEALRDRVDAAGARALRWRQELAAAAGWGADTIAGITCDLLPLDLLVVQPRRNGWVTIGVVNDQATRDRVRIFWHEATNRVQVERHTPHRGDVPVCWYGVVICVDDEGVELRARRAVGSSTGGVRLRVPVPLPRDRRQRNWFLAMLRRAAVRVQYVRVPADFPFWSGLERRQFMIDFAYDLALRFSPGARERYGDRR